MEDVRLAPPVDAPAQAWRVRVSWLDPETGDALPPADGTAALELTADES